MSRYRVAVTAYVVVEAANQVQAKALAELAVRKAVKAAYTSTDDALANLFADDDGARMAYLAKSAVKVIDDD